MLLGFLNINVSYTSSIGARVFSPKRQAVVFGEHKYGCSVAKRAAQALRTAFRSAFTGRNQLSSASTSSKALSSRSFQEICSSASSPKTGQEDTQRISNSLSSRPNDPAPVLADESADTNGVIAAGVSSGVRRNVPAEVLDCVVKIFVTYCMPSYDLPWAMKSHDSWSASGFLIKNRRILTNAHAVEHQTSILVKRRGSDEKFVAELLAVSHEADLALLTVREDEFWEDDRENNGNGYQRNEEGYKKTLYFPYFPLLPQALPNLQDAVTVIGYPLGGDNLSITSGVVSRIEMVEYIHGKTELLAVQIDAAINSGNSGGPVINSSCELIGIAHQGYDASEAELIGYFIPRSVVDHFLHDYEDNGKYTGFSTCGFRWQNLGSESLRRACKLPEPKRARGILIKSVEPTSDASRVLQKGDIVTKIDNIEISDQGTVPFMLGERIGFNYLITGKSVGEFVKIEAFRNGKLMDLEYRLSSVADTRLVRTHEVRKQPEYFIVGGLTFVALTLPFVKEVFGDVDSAPTRIQDCIRFGQKLADDHEIVILSQVLVSSVNVGFHDLDVLILDKFNGKKVMNLRSFAEMVKFCKQEFLKFDLDEDETVILGRKEAIKANKEILRIHRIPASYSIGPLKDR